MPSRTKSTPLRAKIQRHARHHARMAAVPHKGNQYKPHVIRRHGLAIVCMVVFALFALHMGTIRNVLGTEAQVTNAGLLEQTNSEREKVGAPPLQMNKRLSDAAYLKAKDMLAQQYWSHNSPTGVQPWRWLADAGYNYSYAGENLARNFETSDAVVRAWMASPSHRENVLKTQYTDVGFATVDGTMNGHPISLVVAMYGAPALAGMGAVQGANFSAPVEHANVATRMGRWLQSASPALLTSMVLLAGAAFIALLTYAYRNHLPKYMQNTWNRHQGLVKAVGLLVSMIVVIVLYGTDGQL